jgi:AraC-like DNA-binding protein
MYLKRLGILFFTVLLSQFSTSQTKKELERMDYNSLKTAFFENENDVERQKKYAKAYVERAKKENNIEEISNGFFYHTYFVESSMYYEYCDSIISLTKNINSKKFPMQAYTRKAIRELENKDYVSAINNLLLSEKFALKNNNLEFYFDTKTNIAIIKSEYLGEYEEALVLFKQSYNYFKKIKKIKGNQKEYLVSIIFGLSDVFKSLKYTDSATYYNKLGYKESIKIGSDEMKNLFILNEGANQILKKNYIAAIDSINIALPQLVKVKDKGNTMASFYYLADAYKEMKNTKKTIENYEKVDSMYHQEKLMYFELSHGYQYLIDYYKKANNKEKQLYYINTLMEIDSSFQKNYRILSQKINKEYDIPNLMQEKNSIIQTLNQDKKVNYGIIILLGILVCGSLLVLLKQMKQKNLYQKRFNQLVIEAQEDDKNNNAEQNKKEENFKTVDVPKEIIVAVLEKIALFEKEKRYSNASISIQTLAQNFNTNTKYLSSIINHTFEKSFTHYINDLRIDQIVQELKSNKNLRKYTINGIAEEAGFNNGESFSKAFFKRTGIKPSYFIKEINKI